MSDKSKSIRVLSNSDLIGRFTIVLEEVVSRLERADGIQDELDEAETKIGDLEAGITEAREKLGELI